MRNKIFTMIAMSAISTITFAENNYVVVLEADYEISKQTVPTPPPTPSCIGNEITRSELDTMIANGDDLSLACVSKITDFSNLFSNKDLTSDITGWDVSSGTNFDYMFSATTSFNQDISGWDTSKGTSFRGMFQYNQAFDQDISRWNVSSVSSSFDYSNFRLGAILQHKHIPADFQ
ncbi:BspA family leucine-rich repeat surface protein [Vibrio parahaemolyticus]